MIIRILLMAACSISGYFIGSAFTYHEFSLALIGLFLGLLIAISVIRAEQAIRKVSLRVIFGGVVGMIIGLFITFFLAYGLTFVGVTLEKQQVAPWIYALLAGIMGYLGLVIGSKKIEEFSLFGFGQ